MDILQIKNLSKRFGKTQVINDISLCVPEHSVFGFIGANGAGKTTTMKMILGLLKADQGEIWLCDEKVRFGETKTNQHVGYLPDVPEFYNYMHPKEYLKLCGAITGMPADKIKSRSSELLELVGLQKANRKIGGFSRGMKQRLGVAQALLHEPRLLICDEPTSALDPIGRKEILDILKRISGKTTVLFSTHILSDVERICDRAVVLHGGKILLDGTLSDLKASHREDYIVMDFTSLEEKAKFIQIASTPDETLLCEAIQNSMQYDKKEDTEFALYVTDVVEAKRAILRMISQHDILPNRIEVAEPSFENLFLEAVS